ncbi:MAG: hypothetical protein HYX93_06285 [Chloroflexi bacterium]|nr:hypothetical protein [Chloroflexota bacterium]
MGGRDYSHRETKKSKKEARAVKVEALTPSPEVLVVKKGKARKEQEQ